MKKINRIFIMVMISILLMFTLTGCWLEWGDFTFSFESRCKTTEDGFVFYLDIRNDNRLCLIELPETEEVIIPEFIDGHKVMQLGFEEIGIGFRKLHTVLGKNIKKLTITSPLCVLSASFDLQLLIFLNCFSFSSDLDISTLRIKNKVGNSFYGQNFGKLLT